MRFGTFSEFCDQLETMVVRGSNSEEINDFGDQIIGWEDAITDTEELKKKRS